MKIVRRILGVTVMIAGILGLVLSLAGLISVWAVKPTIASFMGSTLATLNASIITSQKAMDITGQALGATVDSVDALSVMLGATAKSVEDTKPVLDQLNVFMGDKLPATMESATSSLRTAQQGAVVLDEAIQSLNAFRTAMSGVPLISAFVQAPKEAYNPDKPLSESLGEVAANLDALPKLFEDMAKNMDKADDNLGTIQTSLVTMADSVGLISDSLSDYEAMVGQSKASMDNLKLLLASLQANLNQILTYGAIVMTLFFAWLLAAQVVILTQGWELYQGTADRMESATED